MKNYSKLFGSVIGAGLAFLVAEWGFPEVLADDSVVEWLVVTIGTGFGTYIAPANDPG